MKCMQKESERQRPKTLPHEFDKLESICLQIKRQKLLLQVQ